MTVTRKSVYITVTDPARNASTTWKFVNMFAAKMACAQMPDFILIEFTLSTNSTFRTYPTYVQELRDKD
jgi:hypothetical protein